MVYLSSLDYTILFLLSRKLKGQFGGIKNAPVFKKYHLSFIVFHIGLDSCKNIALYRDSRAVLSLIGL